MMIRGVFFDFGFVIGFPRHGIDRKYFYLDWDGIDAICKDQKLAQHLRVGVGRVELETFFVREIYNPFVQHEQSDAIDPQSNKILLDRLHLVFDCPIDQSLVDRLLAHIDTMKYITIDTTSVKTIDELKQRNLQISLVSNMMLPGKLLKAKLQEANILDLFDNIIISSDVGFIKPHPEIFQKALAQSRLSVDEVVFIGDTYQQDIIGAKRVNLKTVWLNNRHEPREMAQDNPPDFEIDSLSELLELPIIAG